MTFQYDIENEEGEVLATVEVEADFSHYVPARIDGRPEDCYPAEGGELEDLWVYQNGKDITGSVDDRFGEGTYKKLCNAAYDKAEKHHWRNV